MCVFFDSGVAEQCREDDAEEVKNKEGANFCDYFRPNHRAHDLTYAGAESRARAELDALFGAGTDGDDNGNEDDSGAAAEDLFR